MPVYDLEKLMDETRRLASEYRKSTGSTLPVSAELAKYDAIKLLKLSPLDSQERAVDALWATPEGNKKVQVKGRVIFEPTKSGYRVGQFNLDADWDIIVLVLMNQDYETYRIYRLDRERLLEVIAGVEGGKKNVRGAMSVKKFAAVSQLCWCLDNDSESL